MKMPQCVAWNCTNKSGPTGPQGKSFHLFPRDSERRKAWVSALRREGFKASDTAVICGDHFEESCFNRSGYTTRLKPDAVPTLFNFPDHLKKIPKRHKPPTDRTTSSIQDRTTSSIQDRTTSLIQDRTTSLIQDRTTSSIQDRTTSLIHDRTTSSIQDRTTSLIQDRTITSVQDRTASSIQDSLSPILAKTSGESATTCCAQTTLSFNHDHSYTVTLSPKELKRKIEELTDTVEMCKKKLKISQQRARRLKKRVDSLQDSVKTPEREQSCNCAEY